MKKNATNCYKFFMDRGFTFVQLIEKGGSPRNPIGKNLFDKFSPFIRRNESQIAVWHPAQFKAFSRIARGTGDEGRNMGAEGVKGICGAIRWPPRKLAPLLSPEKPNCR